VHETISSFWMIGTFPFTKHPGQRQPTRIDAAGKAPALETRDYLMTMRSLGSESPVKSGNWHSINYIYEPTLFHPFFWIPS
jgi:hypothetical protein